MTDTSNHVYTEGDKFFFDAEIYNENGPTKFLDYEDGDRIKWIWEDKKMTGILRDENPSLGIFVIENVTTY